MKTTVIESNGEWPTMRLDRGEEEKSFRKKRFKDIVEAVEFSFLCDEKVESRNVDISRIGEDNKKKRSAK